MIPTPPPGWLVGIDTSRWQGTLDVPSLRGVSFVSAKASQWNDMDPQWPVTARSCADHGMPLSPYLVIANAGLDHAEEQADCFVEVVQDYTFALPPVIDWELPLRPDLLTRAQAAECIAAARACAERVESELGVECMIYTGAGFVAALTQRAGIDGAADMLALSQRALWVADYGSGKRVLMPGVDRPRIPHPWSEARWWQVGPFGATLPGRATPVDIDWFKGTVEELFGSGQSVKQSA